MLSVNKLVSVTKFNNHENNTHFLPLCLGGYLFYKKIDISAAIYFLNSFSSENIQLYRSEGQISKMQTTKYV